MALKMPFEMGNLTSFPMEKLCYELKLEVLEGMDAKDTIELVKVNAGFQWMLSRNPSLVFNHHVNEIEMNGIEMDGKIHIGKFSVSDDIDIDASHLPLSKVIHSCDRLEIRFGRSGGTYEQLKNEHATILNQLNSVRILGLLLCRKESLLKFFDNFRSVIEKSAWIHLDIDLLEENQVISELFENFISNQLKDCERVWWYYCGSAAPFHFYYDAFAKTSIKILSISTKVDNFEEIVQSIVEKGIPSKNSKAAFYVCRQDVWGIDVSQEVKARIVDFLSQFRGMKRFDLENQQEVTKMATEFVNKFCGGSGRLLDGPFFRRNIDASRDCIYMLPWRGKFDQFLAFYIEPQ